MSRRGDAACSHPSWTGRIPLRRSCAARGCCRPRRSLNGRTGPVRSLWRYSASRSPRYCRFVYSRLRLRTGGNASRISGSPARRWPEPPCRQTAPIRRCPRNTARSRPGARHSHSRRQPPRWSPGMDSRNEAAPCIGRGIYVVCMSCSQPPIVTRPSEVKVVPMHSNFQDCPKLMSRGNVIGVLAFSPLNVVSAAQMRFWVPRGP